MRSKLSTPPPGGARAQAAAAAVSPEEAGSSSSSSHATQQPQQEQEGKIVEWADGTPIDKKVVTMKLKYRNKKEMVRDYESLLRERAENEAYKPLPGNVPQDATLQEGKAALNAYREEDAKKAFEDYRDSGKLEKMFAKGTTIDDAMRYVENTPQTWCRVFRDCEPIRTCLVGEVASMYHVICFNRTTTRTDTLHVTWCRRWESSQGPLWCDCMTMSLAASRCLPTHYQSIFLPYSKPSAIPGRFPCWFH